MRALVLDITLALRALRRSRGFVALAIVSLGIALGVTTTMFGVVDTALNPVAPLRDPAGLVSVVNAGDGARHDVAWRDVYANVERPPTSSPFARTALVARSYSYLRIGSVDGAGSVDVVGPGFFAVTGIHPFLGRAFADDGRDRDVAMISFAHWRRALGGQRDLRGARVEVEGRVYQVVGVLPSYLPASLAAAVILPMHPGAADIRYATLLARLRPGITVDRAQEQLRASVDPILTSSYGVGRRPFRFLVRPVLDQRPEDISDLQRILLASALVVLVIACGNLANLMLARGLARERDYALSFALGARRLNVIRQTIFEGLFCALGGSLIGIVIAIWAFDLTTYRMTREVPGLGAMAVSLNWRIFGFSVLAATVTSLIAALVPAVRASGVDLGLPLKSGAGTTTGRVRHRYSALVIGEVALTMSLMLGASLLMRAVHAMKTAEFGYNPRGLIDIGVSLRRATGGQRPAVPAHLMQDLAARVRAHPGVTAAALHGVGNTPRNGMGLTSILPGGGNRRLYAPSYSAVGHAFLSTLGIPVIDGRDFADGDAAGRGAAILNEAAARTLWPGGSPIGGMLMLGDLGTGAPLVPVVGVARNVQGPSTIAPVTEAAPEVWVVPPPGLVVLDRVAVRVAERDEAAMRTALEHLTRETLPPGSITVVHRALESFDAAILARDFVGKLFIAFGAIALGLSAVGLYCLLAFVVARRRREFAVRRALGASGGRIARMILHDSAVMVLAGTGIGAFVAMALARALDALLYSVFYTDVVALIVAELLVMVVAGIACLVPARRAARSEPVEMMRA